MSYSPDDFIIPHFSYCISVRARRFQDEETNRFYLDNGKEKLILPAMTFKSIVSPESLHPQPEAFKDAEIAEESPAAVLGKTTLPEFSMIRLTTLKKLTVVIPNRKYAHFLNKPAAIV